VAVLRHPFLFLPIVGGCGQESSGTLWLLRHIIPFASQLEFANSGMPPGRVSWLLDDWFGEKK
jgi:hypothetical protein